MPDWHEFVRSRLRGLGLGRRREEEICAELAGHLEDAYQSALERGLSTEAAMAEAREQVSDWHDLERKIRRVGREEERMSHTARTLWVPGTSMLLFATALLMVMTSVVPPTTWAAGKSSVLFLTDMLAPGEQAEPPWLDARPAVILLGIWMFCYAAFGAIGACWSRRVGGSPAARFLSGIFPLALHLVLFVPPILVQGIVPDPRFPEFREAAWLLRTTLIWVLIPGVILAMGTLPFLRGGAEKQSSYNSPVSPA